MPRKLAFTGGHQVEVVEYEDRPLAPNELRIQTEYASGKHGTPLAMMDGRNDQGQRWDDEMRLFIPTDEPRAENLLAGARVGTSGVGAIIEVGSDVSDWKVGDRIVSFLDVSETNIVNTRRQLPWQGPPLWLDGCIWPLGDIDPLTALCFEPAFVSFHCIRESQRPLCRHGRRHWIGRDRSAGGAPGGAEWRGTDLRRRSAAQTAGIGVSIMARTMPSIPSRWTPRWKSTNLRAVPASM